MEPPHDYPPEYDTTEIQAARIAHLEQVEESMNRLCGELTADLARVKAESLRVVPDGEAVGMDELSCNEWLLLFDGNVYYREYECGTFTTFDDRALFIATDDAVVVTPVRLERWETEE